MSIDRMCEKEVFDFFGNLDHINSAMFLRVSRQSHLRRREERSPLLYKLAKHAIRPTLFDLSKSSEDRQLIVGHAHFCLVRLNRVVGADRNKFCRRNCIKKAEVNFG